MANLELKTTFHRGKNRIGIYFKQDLSIQEIIRKDFGAKWNRTFSYWCVDHHISDLKKLKMILDSYHIIDQLQFTGKSPEDSIIISN